MIKNNFKNYFIISVLILSASYMVQNNAFAQVAPDLGTAGSFGVLGSSTVTNDITLGTGTVITGDLGLSPSALTFITGFPPGTVTGATHAADTAASTAQTDALTAYNALASQACTNTAPWPSNAGVRDMTGLTLGPGVYCSDTTSSLILSSGILTLNGPGVYIFRTDTTLTTITDTNVVLTNGATAANVFWQVGTSATLAAPAGPGTSPSVFPGTIIASQSISETGGITGTILAVNGRLLALNAAVTFASSTTVNVPLTPLEFHASESPIPSRYHPSLGGVEGQTFSDGLKINGHVFDVSKFHDVVPQQALALDKPATITIKQGLTRGSPFWQHAMVFMNFGGKDTITGNADTWISVDKNDGLQVHDPNGFLTNVSANNTFIAYGMTTTFTFTPVKQMSDSNLIIRVWDNQNRQTDAFVEGAVLLGDAPVVKQVVYPVGVVKYIDFRTLSDAISADGYSKAKIMAHIQSDASVFSTTQVNGVNTNHYNSQVYWLVDNNSHKLTLIIADENGNTIASYTEQLTKNLVTYNACNVEKFKNHCGADSIYGFSANTKGLSADMVQHFVDMGMWSGAIPAGMTINTASR